MKNILHIMSSPRGEVSYSIRLGRAIVSKIAEAHPGSILVERNVAQHNLPHLSSTHLESFFTPPELQTDANRAAIAQSDEAVAEVKAADIIVIGVPLYNFGVPSTLKSWIDHIVRVGQTFRYDPDGSKGLLSNKKVYVALASGGVYSNGPMQRFDSVTPYLKNVFSFIGIPDVEVVRAEGTQIPNLAPTALEKGIAAIAV